MTKQKISKKVDMQKISDINLSSRNIKLLDLKSTLFIHCYSKYDVMGELRYGNFPSDKMTVLKSLSSLNLETKSQNRIL